MSGRSSFWFQKPEVASPQWHALPHCPTAHPHRCGVWAAAGHLNAVDPTTFGELLRITCAVEMKVGD